MPEIPIKITSWPDRPELACYVSELPSPPDVQPWPDGVTDDPAHRFHVNKREHDDLVRYVRDMHMAVETVVTCLRQVMQGVGQ